MNTILFIIIFSTLVAWFVLYLTVGFNPFNIRRKRFRFRFDRCTLLNNHVEPQYSNTYGLCWISIKQVAQDIVSKDYLQSSIQIDMLSLKELEGIKRDCSTLENCRLINKAVSDKCVELNKIQSGEYAAVEKQRIENLKKLNT